MRKFEDLYDSNGKQVGLKEVIEWWLNHYDGLEHLAEGGTASPETWYTITTILGRCFKRLKFKRLKKEHNQPKGGR